MHFNHSRALGIVTQQRRGELLGSMSATLPRLAVRAETLAYFLLVTLFWGLIIYFGILASGR